MADTMATGADNNSKEEQIDTPIITHTQDISIKYIVTTIDQSLFNLYSNCYGRVKVIDLNINIFGY